MYKKAVSKIFLSILMVLLFAASTTACGAQSSAKLDQVSVRLKWDHQVQFAGFYVAEQEGYYAEAGLNVDLNPIEDRTSPTYVDVLAGNTDIGVGGASELLAARSQGKPLVVIAVIFRHDPFVLLSKPESNIHSPYDFPGKKIAISVGASELAYNAMLSQTGIDINTINTAEPASWDVLDCLQSADACNDYATGGMSKAQYQGTDLSVIWPSDYGVLFYGDVIFTTEEFIQNHPDVVKRFVQATMKGWQTALENIEIGVNATVVYNSELDAGFQEVALENSVPLIDTGEAAIGVMDALYWGYMQDTMLSQGEINNAVDLDQFFTNEFVQ